MTGGSDTIGEVLRQAFMSREEYQELREEEKVWRWLKRPLIMCVATVIWIGVIASAVISLNVVFPSGGGVPFCSKHGIQPLSLNMSDVGDSVHSFFLTEYEAAQYFWLAVFIPTALVFCVSVTYLLAGMAVAYSAPDRHGCIRVVENNCCASKRGGVRCLATLNGSFAIAFAFLALFLGSSILTLETDCSTTLFWCYEMVCWGLVLLFGGTFFFLRCKVAVIMDEGEFYGSRIVGMEMLDTHEIPPPEMERRLNVGFKSWMGSSILSSDEEEGPPTHGLDDVWEEDKESYYNP
eukprot:c24778_g1_i1 orf=636-1514(-)